MTTICRILLILLVLLLVVPSSPNASNLQNSWAEHLLGVTLNEHDLDQFSEADLERLERFGFSILEVEGYVPDRFLRLVNRSHLVLFVRQKRMFSTADDMLQNDSLYTAQDLELIQYYRQQTNVSVAAYGLFTYPDDRSLSGRELLTYHASRIRTQEPDAQIYYRSAYSSSEPAAFSFRSVLLKALSGPSLPAEIVHFFPTSSDYQSLSDLKHLLEVSLQSSRSLILLPYTWFSDQADAYELLEDVFQTYNNETTVLFPLPNQTEAEVRLHWVVILLLLLAGSYGIHYRLSAFYRNSLFRYFISHRFFTDNLIGYRLRTFSTGMTLFLQHVIIIGIAAWIMSDTAVSTLGLEALQYHLHLSELPASGPVIFFLAGLIAALFLQLFAVSWIRLLNRRTRISQIMTLYGWPLQFNFPVVICMTALGLSGGSSNWIFLTGFILLIVWFSAFSSTAIATSRYVSGYKPLYILATIGLQVLIGFLIVWLALFYPPVTEPLRMVVSLP